MSVRSVESALDDVIEVLAELGPLHIFAKEPELRYRSDAIAKYGILDAAYRIADGRLPTDRPGLKVLRTLNLVASPSEHARASEVNLLDELARETEEKQLFVKLFLEQREQLTSWPREFVVHDACSTNAPSIWLAKHFYL